MVREQEALQMGRSMYMKSGGGSSSYNSGYSSLGGYSSTSGLGSSYGGQGGGYGTGSSSGYGSQGGGYGGSVSRSFGLDSIFWFIKIIFIVIKCKTNVHSVARAWS